MVSITCDWCGQEFDRKEWEIRETHNFCRRECFHAWQKSNRPTLVCDWCSMSEAFHKDPDAVLDYVIIWYSWLGSDRVASHTVTADAGITVDSSEANSSEVTIDGTTYPINTVVTVWLSGGTAGERYAVTVHVVTDADREEDRTFEVSVVER